jgi:hypothetical protein
MIIVKKSDITTVTDYNIILVFENQKLFKEIIENNTKKW